MNTKIFYASLLALGLTACGGRGSFDTLSIKENIDSVKPGAQSNEGKKPLAPNVPKTEPKGVLKPSLGYAVAVPVRDTARRSENGDFLKSIVVDGFEIPLEKETLVAIDDKNAIALLDGDLDYINIKGKEKFKTVRDFEKESPMFDYKFVRAGIVRRNGDRQNEKLNSNQDPISIKNDIEAYAYYKGTEAASALPSDLKVIYDGHWEFMTDARLYRTTKDEKRKVPKGFNPTSPQGYEYGALSTGYEYRPVTGTSTKPVYPIANEAHFEVNFADKSMKGQLYLGDQKARHTGDISKALAYEVNARVLGNRFHGSAEAKLNAGNVLYSTYANATNRLEGGFFGPKAEELAGNFITDDNSLYGVFAAKQKNASQNTESVVLAQLLDTTYGKIKQTAHIKEISYDEDTGEEIVKEENKNLPDKTVPGANEKTNFSLLGDIDRLIVDGREFKLVSGQTVSLDENGRKFNATAYKGNLEFVRLGKVFKSGYTHVGEEEQVTSEDSEDEDSNKEITQKITTVYPDQDGYFLQGVLTEAKNVPNSGSAKYDGVWGGKIHYFNREIGTNHNTAHFDVDFGSKKITGNLKDFGQDAFKIDATIDKNTFSGNVTSLNKIKLDNAVGGTTNTSSAFFDTKDKNISVNGAFFGPKAEELAGSFSGKGNLSGGTNNENKEADIGVVFGAKKTN